MCAAFHVPFNPVYTSMHTQTLIYSNRQREESSVHWFLDEHRSHAQLIVLWGVAAPIIVQLQVEINTVKEGEGGGSEGFKRIKALFSWNSNDLYTEMHSLIVYC